MSDQSDSADSGAPPEAINDALEPIARPEPAHDRERYGPGGRERHGLGGLLLKLYGFGRRGTRNLIRRIAIRTEGGEMRSLTLRRIFTRYHGVDIGVYTQGAFVPGNIRAGTRIGRYCSFTTTARTFNANHPMNLMSSHAMFVNPKLGYTDKDLVPRVKLAIGNDVWLGHNSIILPSVTCIGDGAVIGAGTVVHKDVPPYAIVIGHPCRVVRWRFSQAVIDRLLASRWWDTAVEELDFAEFQRPLEGDEIR
ncbi:MAG TPA: transferase [Planctomycetes bacterium]|nr:transferase [Planctomycetota bacterium]